MRKAVLDLSEWSVEDINNLPDMQVDGEVELSISSLRFNEEIKRIPIFGLKVGGSLSLYGCESLTSLPKGLKVGGYLSLTDCKSLTSLPEGLEVGGSLSLGGCTLLKSLPKGLKVGGDLWLYDCKLLKSLPQDLEVEGDNIYYNSETGFAQIKGWKDDPNIIPTHLKDKVNKL